MGDHNQEWTDNGWMTAGRKRNSKENRFMPDIATAQHFNWEKRNRYTSYFVTDFPDNYGAKALFNAFQYYGDIAEVVIPVKRDRGGRRFGFARFDRVSDIRQLESELDSILIGRNNISVNLSRYNKPERNSNPKISDISARSMEDKNAIGNPLNQNNTNHHHSNKLTFQDRNEGSYANMVRKGVADRSVVSNYAFSFSADESELGRFEKAYVGVVDKVGKTFKIQDALHAQGYFGVKATPLGPNLILLEDMEEGAVEALIDTEGEWLHQWFKEIHHWHPKDLDGDRLVWLKVFGVPAHVWNERFFTTLSKQWGVLLHADESTTAKQSLDVARLLVCTPSRSPVDDSLNVKINDEIFFIRVVEEAVGPSGNDYFFHQKRDGRTYSEANDEEGDDDDHMLDYEEGTGENLMVFKSFVKASNRDFSVRSIEEDALSDNEPKVANSVLSIVTPPFQRLKRRVSQYATQI